MSLISCPECGKQISDQSEHCIYCGFPLNKLEKENKAFDESKVIYDFYLVMALPSPRPPLARIASAKRTVFDIYIDGALVKSGLRPYDVVHFRATKDFSIRVLSNEFRKEGTAAIRNNDKYFVVNELQPRVFLLRYFNTGWTVSLFDGFIPITDGYNYKDGVFVRKQVGPMTEADLKRVIAIQGGLCKAFSGRDYEIVDINI